VFGFDDGNRPYRYSGYTVQTVAVQTTTIINDNRSSGILGWFATLGSKRSSSTSSSGYRQPPTSAPAVLCEPLEGVICQPLETVVCQPVEGVTCQPVTMVHGPLPGS
jgi:hypothetical protein